MVALLLSLSFAWNLDAGQEIVFDSGDRFQVLELLADGTRKEAYLIEKLGCEENCRLVLSICSGGSDSCIGKETRELFKKIRRRKPPSLRAELGVVEFSKGVGRRSKGVLSEYTPSTVFDFFYRLSFLGEKGKIDSDNFENKARAFRALMEQASHSLQELGSLGYSHGDVRPMNLFVRYAGDGLIGPEDLVEGRALAVLGDFDDGVPSKGVAPSDMEFLVKNMVGTLLTNRPDRVLKPAQVRKKMKELVVYAEKHHPESLEDLAWVSKQVEVGLSSDPQLLPIGKNAVWKKGILPLARHGTEGIYTSGKGEKFKALTPLIREICKQR